MSGLIYEVVWSRILTLVFGASIYGQSIGLALFMGGMALGSKLLADRLKTALRPALWYGVLEAITGIFGGVSVFLIPLSERLELVSPLPDQLLKLLIASFFILPASIAMGGTFPALFKALVSDGERRGGVGGISNLYAVNTLGAMAGIVLCNYFLIPELGMRKSIFSAAVLNLLIFLFMAAFKSGKALGCPENGEQAHPEKEFFRKGPLALLFLSGFLTMMYEISWSRALYFSFGSSTFTFSLIIFAFILGLGLGAFRIRRKEGLGEEERKILIMDLLVKTFIAAAIFTYIASRMPLVMPMLFQFCKGVFWKVHLMELALLLSTLSPVAFFIGAAFPMLISLVPREGAVSERCVGVSYSVNTVGAIAGSLLTGFALVPWLGPFNLIWVALGLHAVGIVLISRPFDFFRLKNPFFALACGAAFTLIQMGDSKPYEVVAGGYTGVFQTSGTYLPLSLQRNTHFLLHLEELKKTEKEDFKMIFNRHGRVSTVTVFQSPSQMVLSINGKPDATAGKFTMSDMPTETFLGMLPVLFAGKAEEGLVIGYGSGISAGIASKYTGKVDCLEIERGVLEASGYFSKYNLDSLHAKNLNLVLGDARKYIRNCTKRYDFISAEPSNIWVSGVAHLFTQEFFKDCRGILNEDGVMVQWLHIYKLSLKDFKTAIRTFSSVFEDFEIWGTFNIGDVFLVGRKKGGKGLSKEKFEKFLENYCFRQEMSEIEAGNWEGFLHYRIIDGKKLIPLLKGVPVHTDDLPVLEYSAIKNMFVLQSKEIYNFLGE